MEDVSPATIAAVHALMARVGREVVMPRLGALAAGEVGEKSPGEWVTIADREAEAALAAGLTAIDASARVVGEEACDADPSLLDALDTGRVWLVDPVDGTANFAAGRAPFGIMVALVEAGETLAGWLLDPVTGRACHAVQGSGAFVDGQRVRVRPTGRARPVAALSTRFLPPADAEMLRTRAGATLDLVPIPGCAAEHYPRLVLGENDAALFTRTMPWDHAAGALLLTEAGGIATRANGERYRPGTDGYGLVAAADARGHALVIAALADRPGASA